MHNQHTGLSQVLAEQRIAERQQEAIHARLWRAPRSSTQQATNEPTSKQDTKRPPTQGQVGEAW